MENILTFIDSSPFIVYPSLVLIAWLEGPIIMLASGFLIRSGHLPLVPAYLALMFGDLIGDALWYAIGRYGGKPFLKKYGHYFSITEEKIDSAKEVFHQHHEKILVLSKVTMGFGFALATLMAAGMTHVPFRKYMAINALGQLFWTGLLLAIGYFFGNAYLAVNDVLGKMSLLAVFVLGILLFLGLRARISSRITHSS